MKLLFIFSFLLASLAAFPQATLGDVKYSVLDPDTFMGLNPGWVLMDGGASQKSDSLFKISRLHLELKFPSLPDARGIFIRGMNGGRPTGDGDPDGDVMVGRYQRDAIMDHLHKIKNIHSEILNPGPGYNWEVSILNPADPNFPTAAKEDLTSPGLYTTDGRRAPESAETRPRNISLYVYIKIN